jgi:A/G-specific adenine glycosylase
MDLGATLCTRSRPACTVCPMNDGCTAALEGRQAALPGPKQNRLRPSREATLLIAQRGVSVSSSVLVERRPASGIWGGLWSPPQFDSQSEAIAWCVKKIGQTQVEATTLAPIDHAFTHFDLRLNPLRVRCQVSSQVREDGDLLWYRLDSPPRIGLPQPIVQLFERLRAHEGIG